MNKSIDFFLGANTSGGFASYFSELCDPAALNRLFLIKSGPGTGKSGLIKSIISSMPKDAGTVERIHCSSDPDSLDGVLFHGIRAAVVDATPPHAIEPAFPGAFESVISFYELIDNDKLYENKEAITNLIAANSAYHKRCQNFLQAAKSLLSDSYITALKATNTDKIARYAKRVALKEFTAKKGGLPVEHKRFLSAVTPKGVVIYDQTAKTLCDRVYLINDDHGVSANLLFSALRNYALSYGHEIFTCFCPLSPYDRIEHLFIPSLNLGFMTMNRYLKPDIDPYRVIHATRFTDMNALKLKKQRLSFNRKAAAELISEAVRTLKDAKQNHDKIEEFYTGAMDFTGLEAKQSETLKELKKLVKASKSSDK